MESSGSIKKTAPNEGYGSFAATDYSSIIRSIPSYGSAGSAASQAVMQDIINDAVERLSSKAGWSTDQLNQFELNINQKILDAAAASPDNAQLQQAAAAIQSQSQPYWQELNQKLVDAVITNKINDIKNSLTLTEEDKQLAIAQIGTRYLTSIGMEPISAAGLTELLYKKSVQDVGAKGFTWENFKEEGADALLNVGQGVVTGTKLLAAAFGANSAGAQALGEMESWMGGLMSDESKTDKERIGEIMAEAQDQPWFEQLKIAGRAFAVDPASMVLNALGTTIPALAGAALVAATAPVSGTTALVLGGTAVGTAMGLGTAKDRIYDDVYNAALNQGHSEAEAIMIAIESQSYTGDQWKEILASGAIGAIAGSTGIEGAVMRLAGQAASKGLLKPAVLSALGESISEFGEGGIEKIASNAALINQGEDVAYFDGVLGAGFLEGMVGGVTGGGVAVGEVAFGGNESNLGSDISIRFLLS